VKIQNDSVTINESLTDDSVIQNITTSGWKKVIDTIHQIKNIIQSIKQNTVKDMDKVKQHFHEYGYIYLITILILLFIFMVIILCKQCIKWCRYCWWHDVALHEFRVGRVPSRSSLRSLSRRRSTGDINSVELSAAVPTAYTPMLRDSVVHDLRAT
jgi:hypothetical protein